MLMSFVFVRLHSILLSQVSLIADLSESSSLRPKLKSQRRSRTAKRRRRRKSPIHPWYVVFLFAYLGSFLTNSLRSSWFMSQIFVGKKQKFIIKSKMYFRFKGMVLWNIFFESLYEYFTEVYYCHTRNRRMHHSNNIWKLYHYNKLFFLLYQFIFTLWRHTNYIVPHQQYNNVSYHVLIWNFSQFN